jgi:electron transfer flavoprotein beta subunit
MKIVIPVKLIPDLVDELVIDASGTSLDYDWLRLKLNELDEHAIEEGLLLKDRYGGHVTVMALDDESTDEVLFTAAAKGVDQLVKICSGPNRNANNHTLVSLFLPHILDIQPDLILMGVQAHNDLDGSLGPLLAEALSCPYLGYISRVSLDDGSVTASKEFPGGLISEISVKLPAVLGIQSAESPPRYIAFSKIRQAMKDAFIEERPSAEVKAAPGALIERLFQPEVGETAQMIEGPPDRVADHIVALFKELGVI